MSNRNCPKCENKVNPIKLLIMGPAKKYKCASCSNLITVSPTSNRILIYGGLLFFVPAGLFYKVEPSVFSGSVMGMVFIAVLILAIFTQKVISAKT
ncbi:MAG TPA: hypothetical protein ENI67_04660 [Gammaproteobacteria bacterium]|nr:hypothetical protein [Gammaproteobacteria bacterium]